MQLALVLAALVIEVCREMDGIVMGTGYTTVIKSVDDETPCAISELCCRMEIKPPISRGTELVASSELVDESPVEEAGVDVTAALKICNASLGELGELEDCSVAEVDVPFVEEASFVVTAALKICNAILGEAEEECLVAELFVLDFEKIDIRVEVLSVISFCSSFSRLESMLLSFAADALRLPCSGWFAKTSPMKASFVASAFSLDHREFQMLLRLLTS